MKLKSLAGSLAVILTLSGAALAARLHSTAEPAGDEASVAQLTARLLGDSSYTRHRPQPEVASKFLDRYLDMLDGNHLYFLDSDLEEFAPYRRNLEELTSRRGDTRPAHRIFERFRQRAEERAAYAQELLKTGTFDFTGNDSYRWDRQAAPRPHDLADARQLWRQHLRHEYLQEKLSNKKPEEIVQTLTRRYERSLHAMKQWNAEQVLELYLTALAHAYDPHSDYMGPRQAEDFSIAMNLSLVGIGATLQAEDGYCRIAELVPGGPAARGGLLQVGDRIVAVAQDGREPVDVVDMALPAAVALIRGPKGTKVHLTLIPTGVTEASARKQLTLVRDEVKLEDQEAKARIVDLGAEGRPAVRLGVINLPSFYSGAATPGGHSPKSATADVARLIDKLKQEHVQGIALDLRRNGGGSLEEAITLTGLFIQRGPVVQTRDPDGEVKIVCDPDASVHYDGPLVVLTSRFSASASEILAGALQDYGRALVVGDASTFGKGTVQSILPMAQVMHQAGLPVHADPGAMKLTIGKFYRPDGASTQLKGVASDLVLPSTLGSLKVGEAEMPDPLPWDSVAPARHAQLNRVAPYLPALRGASARRTATDPEFVWLRDDMDRAAKQLAHPVVSLNEKRRREEKAEEGARAEARKKERAVRQALPDKQYEISLKNVDQAGLPAPINARHPAPHAGDGDLGIDPDAGDYVAPGEDRAADAFLQETQRILADYIGLMQEEANPTVAQGSPSRSTVAR